MARREHNLSNELQTRQRVVTGPRQIAQVGRNEPCPCGSGKKYKQCHEEDGEPYLAKLAHQRAQAKEEAAGRRPSWFRRLLGG
jgi:hypothetical protein